MTKTIKVAQLPGKVVEIVVEEGATVQQALNIAGLSADGFEVKVDSVSVDVNAVLPSSTQMVLLTKKVKGNTGVVKIAQLPGKVQEIAIEAGTTVQQALELASLSADGFEIKVDSVPADMNTVVDGATMILLTKKVKGN